MTTGEDQAIADARAKQARWDAAALVRACWSGDPHEIVAVVERPGLEPLLVAQQVALLCGTLLNVSAGLMQQVAGDPDRPVRGREASAAKEPAEPAELAEPAPRDLPAAGPRPRGENMRDAVALIDAFSRGGDEDEDGIRAVLASADQVGLPLALARICAEIADDKVATVLEYYGIVAESLDR
jgi:hypothetical protein